VEYLIDGLSNFGAGDSLFYQLADGLCAKMQPIFPIREDLRILWAHKLLAVRATIPRPNLPSSQPLNTAPHELDIVRQQIGRAFQAEVDTPAEGAGTWRGILYGPLNWEVLRLPFQVPLGSFLNDLARPDEDAVSLIIPLRRLIDLFELWKGCTVLIDQDKALERLELVHHDHVTGWSRCCREIAGTQLARKAGQNFQCLAVLSVVSNEAVFSGWIRRCFPIRATSDSNSGQTGWDLTMRKIAMRRFLSGDLSTLGSRFVQRKRTPG
jgi:hypothetical protein